jgi:dihydroceramidase
MLIATGTVLHRVYTFDQSRATTVGSAILLTAALTAFSIWHCVTDELVVHPILFGTSLLHDLATHDGPAASG